MDPMHRSSPVTANDRLNALRNTGNSTSGKKQMSSRKSEVFIGVTVISVGFLLITVLVLRPSKNQSVIGPPLSSISNSTVSEPTLLDGEALIALSVQAGQFPPQLTVGDSVRIAVTPGIDGDGETRLIPGDVLVVDISPSGDGGSESVITVQAPDSVLVEVAGSGELHVAKVMGAQQ